MLGNDDIDQLNPWFSRQQYRSAHPDLADYEKAIENHLIQFGLDEQRTIAPGVFIIKRTKAGVERQAARNPFASLLDTITIGRSQYDVVRTTPSKAIIDQIASQARIDPDVTSVGPECFPFARQFRATDLDTRGLIRHELLLKSIPANVDSIIVAPRLQVGGAEKYAANLIDILSRAGKRCVFLTTDSWEADDRAALSLDILAPLRDVRLVSLREGLLSTWKPDLVLALLLMKASPKQLFVINSEIGLKMVARYGRALRTIMKIHCAFFSESPGAIGAPYSARYLREVVPNSTILSDNQPAIEKWKSRLGKSVADSFVCIPTKVDLPSDFAFERLVASRMLRARSSDRCSALWLSRWEPFKATDVLVKLLKIHPSLHVDAFGPVGAGLKVDDLPKNIDMVGPIANPRRIEVSQYDLMVFTSYFEGMPNAVLEMAAVGMPIVASDVGGLRDTFGDDTLAFVSMEGDADTIALRFKKQIDRLMSESPSELKARILRTRSKLIRHHSLTEVTQKVLSLD